METILFISLIVGVILAYLSYKIYKKWGEILLKSHTSRQIRLKEKRVFYLLNKATLVKTEIIELRKLLIELNLIKNG